MTTLVIYLIITAVVSYLLGGANGAIITSTTFFKKDIRNYGSGNAGLTNFLRTFGIKGVVLLLLVDVLKTVLAFLFGRWLLGKLDYGEIGSILGGFFAMVGHVYPVFYHFKGGKATLAAGTLAWCIDWRVGLVCWAAFMITVIFTKYVSLGSIVGCLFLPISIFIFGHHPITGLIGLLCAGLMIFAHRENIGRLRRGEENKLSIGSGKNI